MIDKIVSYVHRVFAIIASGIAIYIFIAKRKAIASVIKILLNYSSQLTLSELKTKLEQINNLVVDNGEQSAEIENLFSDIAGQLRGNKLLCKKCSAILKKIEIIVENPTQLTNPRKRALISELREQLRHVDMENIDELMGEKK